jgi:Domain of unknown function (DUF4326)
MQLQKQQQQQEVRALRARTRVGRWSQKEDDMVFIGRPSRWGNPWRIGLHGDRAEVLRKYRDWLTAPEQKEFRNQVRRHLRGRLLGCFCSPLRCHGEYLAIVAESEEE